MNRFAKLEIIQSLHLMSQKDSIMKSEAFRVGVPNCPKCFESDHSKWRSHVVREERPPHRSSIPRQSWLPVVRTALLAKSCFMNSTNNCALNYNMSCLLNGLTTCAMNCTKNYLTNWFANPVTSLCSNRAAIRRRIGWWVTGRKSMGSLSNHGVWRRPTGLALDLSATWTIVKCCGG
jgi:hypothetical protein